MRTIRLYVRQQCDLCDEADGLLRSVSLGVCQIDVDEDPVLQQLYAAHVPVADFGGNVRLYWPFTPDQVQAAVAQAAGDDIAGRSQASHPAGERTRKLVVAVDRAIDRFARHWLLFIAFIAGSYAGLPLLAPILMALGMTRPANVIYTVYRLLCHQLPSRSSFIFGQQVCYCDRCMGIYTALFAAVLLFALLRTRIKPLPWQAYLIFVAPMAVDGLTQIVGLRSSNSELRLITGSLFGIGSAWLALPYLEQGFQDVISTLSQKLQPA